MPNDVSAVSSSSISASYDTSPSIQQAAVASTSSAASILPGQPNPTIQLDPSVNVVVVQLHDRQGQVTSSIPTVRHLEAYRIGLLPVPGSQTPSVPAAAPATNAAPPKAVTPIPTPAVAGTTHPAPAAAAPALPAQAAPAPATTTPAAPTPAASVPAAAAVHVAAAPVVAATLAQTH